jgi:hypothetical protein
VSQEGVAAWIHIWILLKVGPRSSFTI